MNEDEFLTRIMDILDEPDPKEALQQLTRLYQQASPQQRSDIRDQWNFNRAWRTPLARTLACHIDDEPTSAERIRTFLLYNAIEDFRRDARDNLVNLCVIYHAALEVGLDVGALFEEVAALASVEGAAQFRSFVHRSEADKALSAFGWRRKETGRGVEYLGWWDEA